MNIYTFKSNQELDEAGAPDVTVLLDSGAGTCLSS